MAFRNSASASDPTTVLPHGRLRAIVAVSAAGLIISIAGAVHIFTFWSSHEQRDAGIVRAAIFAVVMVAVSVAGYLLYVNQFKPIEIQNHEIGWAAYRPALRTAVILQSILLVLGALMLDMGQAIHVCSVSAIAHWIMIALILCRRPTAPTDGDLFAIRWGYLIILLAVMTIGPTIWTRLGRW